MLLRLLKAMLFCIETFFTKIRWGKKLKFSGILRKRIDTQFIISGNSTLNIGNRVVFFRNVAISSVDNGDFCIGNNVVFNRNCIAICQKQITIGDNVLFGPGVTIYDHDHCFGANGVEKGFTTSPVTIEDHCWIGANCIILKGAHIGKGSVIGAGCVVKGEILPYSLVTADRTLKIRPLEERKKNQKKDDI